MPAIRTTRLTCNIAASASQASPAPTSESEHLPKQSWPATAYFTRCYRVARTSPCRSWTCPRYGRIGLPAKSRRLHRGQARLPQETAITCASKVASGGLLHRKLSRSQQITLSELGLPAIRTTRLTRNTAVSASRASPAPTGLDLL